MRFPTGPVILGLSLLALCGVVFGEPDSKPSGPTSGKEKTSEKSNAEAKEFWSSLSEEEQNKLRDALRTVWTDPGVISARESVKEAADAYQESIRSAVSKQDPTVAGLMKRFQEANEGQMRDRIGGGPPGRMGQRRGFNAISPPGFMEKLSAEEREQFRKAESAAMEADSVKAARRAIDELRKEEETLRSKRMEAHRNMRRATFDAMIEAEPALREKIEKLEATPRKGPFGGGRPKGKGEPGKSNRGAKPASSEGEDL